MPCYAIYDDTANLVDWFDGEHVARSALREMLVKDPEEASGYGLLEFDDRGYPVGDVLMGAELRGSP